MIDPRVGDNRLFELSRVTARLNTASCCVRSIRSRSAASHRLNTAQKSAGCASVRPMSIEYVRLIVVLVRPRHSTDAAPPIVVVRRYAMYTETRLLSTVIV